MTDCREEDGENGNRTGAGKMVTEELAASAHLGRQEDRCKEIGFPVVMAHLPLHGG